MRLYKSFLVFIGLFLASSYLSAFAQTPPLNITKDLTINGDVTVTGDVRTNNDRFAPQVIYFDTTTDTVTGAGFQTFKSFTVPGGTLGDGNAIRITAWCRQTGGSNGGRFRLLYGGNSVAAHGSNIDRNPCQLEMVIAAAGGTGNQVGYLDHTNSGNNGSANGASATDSTVDQTLSFQMDLQTDGDTWACDFIVAEVIKE